MKKEQLLEQIKTAIKDNGIMSVRKPLEKAGFKIDSSFSAVFYITATKQKTKFLLCHEKYSDKPLAICGKIAIELMA